MPRALLILALLFTATLRISAEPDGKPTVVPAVLRSVTPTGAVRGRPAILTLERRAPRQNDGCVLR